MRVGGHSRQGDLRGLLVLDHPHGTLVLECPKRSGEVWKLEERDLVVVAREVGGDSAAATTAADDGDPHAPRRSDALRTTHVAA